MDTEVWYRLLAHLVSQSQLSVEGTAGQGQAQVQFVFAGVKDGVGPGDIKQILRDLLSNPATAAQIRKLVENVGEDELAAQVLAIIVTGHLHDGPSASSDEEPRTLRDSIDREWPW